MYTSGSNARFPQFRSISYGGLAFVVFTEQQCFESELLILDDLHDFLL